MGLREARVMGHQAHRYSRQVSPVTGRKCRTCQSLVTLIDTLSEPGVHGVAFTVSPGSSSGPSDAQSPTPPHGHGAGYGVAAMEKRSYNSNLVRLPNRQGRLVDICSGESAVLGEEEVQQGLNAFLTSTSPCAGEESIEALLPPMPRPLCASKPSIGTP